MQILRDAATQQHLSVILKKTCALYYLPDASYGKQIHVNKYGIGQSVRRVEDARFLTGRGRYLDDIALPRQCHGVVLLSTHAHADITRIDTNVAASMPGVVCVLTGADVEADGIGAFPTIYIADERGGPPGFRTLRPLLVRDRVRCVGDRVAFVVAETVQQARDAAEQITVDYAPLPVLMSAEEAIKPDALKIWAGCADNVSFTIAATMR